MSALRRADATVMQPFEIGSAQCAALIAPYELVAFLGLSWILSKKLERVVERS